MKPVGQVTAMVVDNGLFCETAVRLAQAYRKVYYVIPGALQSEFPMLNCGKIGTGMEGIECIEAIDDIDPDEIDLYVFPDVGFGAMQVRLEAEGKMVWGSRRGEELEIYRDKTKELMKSLGLPVGGYEVVVGMDALRKYLKSHKNQYVKINKWRGIKETFKAESYEAVEVVLDEMEHALGEFKRSLPFVVEDELPDKIETGLDAIVIDGQHTKQVMAGIEAKDKGYVAVMKDFDSVPEPISRWNSVMAPTLKHYGYRGPLSTELRIGKDGAPFMVDACCRQGIPPSDLYTELWKNFPELVWRGANGEVPEIQSEAKYGVQVLITSAWADKNWQPINFPKELRRYVKIMNPMVENGRYYSVPQGVELREIASVIGWGNSIQSAVEMLNEMADEVSGYYLNVHTEALDDIQEEIDKLKEIGLDVF